MGSWGLAGRVAAAYIYFKESNSVATNPPASPTLSLDFFFFLNFNFNFFFFGCRKSCKAWLLAVAGV